MSGKTQPPKGIPDEFYTTRLSLQRIERKEWFLWSTALAITILLTAGIASLVWPLLRSSESTEARPNLQTELIGLCGVVLLFALYSIYQQLRIHQIRRRLMESEQLFRLISENAADMIAVVDMEGRRLYNSKSYEHTLGYSPEELQRSSGFEQIHPEDQERVRAASEEARRNGIGKTLEYRMRHKDGSWRVLESKASVIFSRAGVPANLVIVNRDVTERRRAIEALRLSEASFRSVVEDAPYGIYRADDGGHLLRVNPALQKMLEYSSEDELLHANLESTIFKRPDDFRLMRETLHENAEFKDLEMEWRSKNGAPITVRCSGRRVTEPGGDSSYHELFAEDVTDKRALEARLRMAGKMEAIGRLSGGIAHDFNNLLGVMIGYGQLLGRKLPSGSPLSEFAVEIVDAGQRAAALTKQLLAFSRQQILTPTVLDLNALVSNMEKMLPRLIGEDITLSISLQPDVGRVKADRGQLEQVVMNLAVNARDAMPTGGALQIATTDCEIDEAYAHEHPGARPGSYVMLAVKDSGMGIDRETITHIFEPFFTTKELGKGTGLGLATVYGIVKQSEGYIWVDSEPNKGTEFQIFLPRVNEPIAVRADLSPSKEESATTGTILLVEDADPLRKLATSILEGRGFYVLAARSGQEALQLANEHAGPIHLLLTDVVMPGINGRVLAEKLHARRPATKVLYMSGYTDSFIAGHGVLDQSTNLLYKPFTEEVLLERIRKVMDQKAEKTTTPQARE